MRRLHRREHRHPQNAPEAHYASLLGVHAAGRKLRPACQVGACSQGWQDRAHSSQLNRAFANAGCSNRSRLAVVQHMWASNPQVSLVHGDSLTKRASCTSWPLTPALLSGKRRGAATGFGQGSPGLLADHHAADTCTQVRTMLPPLAAINSATGADTA